MTNKFQLPEELQHSTKQEWRSLVEKTLNGKSIEQALATTTADEIFIQPLYDQSDVSGEALPLKESSINPEPGERPWDIIELIDIPDISAANAQINRSLNSGASGLWLSLNTEIPYGGSALSLETVADYKALFDGADLSTKALYFSNGHNSLANAALFSAYMKEAEARTMPAKGSFCFDPIGLNCAANTLGTDEAETIAPYCDAAIALRQAGAKLTPFMASGRIWQQAGASEATELALTLAAYISYARALEAAGEDINNAFAAIDVSLAANSDIFLVTAKLRAMRLLLSKVQDASGASAVTTKIMAEMSWLDMSRTDPEVNMLRATAATVAAGLGNADALLLLPFSTAHGISNSAARRLALNTQIIAQEESHIGTVKDPAAGSWYIESLTAELAEKSWAIFRDIEKDGGLISAINAGTVRELITASRAEAVKAIATGKREITGTTVFPNLEEKAPELMALTTAKPSEEITAADISTLPLAGSGAQNGARFEAMEALISSGSTVSALTKALMPEPVSGDLLPSISTRITSDIEALRQVSDAALEATGKRPSVFLANLGSTAEFTARATWAKSYFETGGIKALTTGGYETSEDAASAFSQSGATIACICSTDEKYEAEAIATAKALHQAGAKAVYLVARPSLLKALGEGAEENFHALLFKGTDITTTLGQAHSLIAAG